MRRLLLGIFCVTAAISPLLIQAQQDLATLIQVGDRKAALAKIASGANVNEAQPDGTRPIHWAVYRVDYELIEALLAKKADLNVRNEFGATPIAEAVKLADARIVKMLLDAGAEPEGANVDGQTALMLAIKTGELPIVEMLLNAGAKVNVVEQFHQQTPLIWAAAATRNAGSMVRMLLAKGADVKPRSMFTDWPTQLSSEPRAQYRPVGGHTALALAARGGCDECVEALIAAGADPNIPTPEGVTPLMLALDNDQNSTAKLLLAKGANPHVWDEWGRTALYIAIDRKPAPGGRGGGRGGAPQAAVSTSSVSSMDIVNALLDAGADPNVALSMRRPSRGGNSGRFSDPLLSTGATPLLRAAQSNDLDVVKALLAKGANPNINGMGLTPFLVAAGVGTGRGGTGLAAQAAVGGDPRLAAMELMIAAGADVNARITGTQTYSMRVSRAPSTNEGYTALHSAAQAGNVAMVRFLLEHGANANLTDAQGRKPIDLVPAGAGAVPAAPGAAKGKGKGPAGPSPAVLAEIRELLTNSAAK